MSVSLRDRISDRRKELEEEKGKTFVLAVPGYEDLLFARYRSLPYEELRRIQLRHVKIGRDPGDEVDAAADMLIAGCEDLLAKGDGVEDDAYESLGKQWTTLAIQDLFNLALPENTTARTAMKAALSSDQIMEHFGAYMGRNEIVQNAVEESVAGESEPSTEG